jgi:hypothetical protein
MASAKNVLVIYANTGVFATHAIRQIASVKKETAEIATGVLKYEGI